MLRWRPNRVLNFLVSYRPLDIRFFSREICAFTPRARFGCTSWHFVASLLAPAHLSLRNLQRVALTCGLSA